MNRSFILLIVLLTILASGCVKNAPKLDLTDNGVKKSLAGQLKKLVFEKEWIEYNCANSGYYNLGISGNRFISFDCQNSNIPRDPKEAEKIRNQVLDSGIGIIDSAYGIYIRDIRKKRSVGEFLADLTEIGASTAIGITNGERAIQVIGVALTGFRGGRKSAQLNLFDEQTTNVLIKRMDASRSQILGEIRQKQANSTDAYSFDAALGDIIRYFDVGTLNRAFTELDKQTGIDAEIARLGVLRIQGLKDISRIPTLEEAQLVTSVAESLSSLEKDLDNPDKRDVATARLKSIYDKIAAKTEFADILNNLRAIANGTKEDDTRSDAFKATLKAAFDKIDKKEPLTGSQYLALINAVFSETESNPDLQKLLLDIFNTST
ncbi:MAG: hypothetical protein ICV68_00260 [Pyrinomonadaceae bacterium]|nr:hypothetical protein [Pyrinomonadaceae bacterium]